jgi:hypothetical protein
MNRWGLRILGLLMLLIFLLLMINLQKQLTEIARQRGVQTTPSPPQSP